MQLIWTLHVIPKHFPHKPLEREGILKLMHTYRVVISNFPRAKPKVSWLMCSTLAGS